MTDFLTHSRRFAFVLLLLSLTACSVHKIDIQQGNVITQEMLEKLKIGMEMKRVENVIGTPLVVDPFHRNRWDYVYFYKSGNTDDRQSAHLTLYFEDGQLSSIDVKSALPKASEVKKPGAKLRGDGGSSTASPKSHSH
jgi:outer membrane protein assembly factor BamE